MENPPNPSDKELSKEQKDIQRLKEDFEAFAYTISHDLREPVRMVRSFMELLEKKYAAELNEKARNYVHYARDGAQRLEQMIQDLLVYYRAVKPEEKKEFEFVSILKEIAEMLQLNHPNFSIHCSNLDVNLVTADKAAWTKIFSFILSDIMIFFQADSDNITEISNSVEGDVFTTEIRALKVKDDIYLVEQSFKLFNKAGVEAGTTEYRTGWAVAKRIIQEWGGSMEAAILNNDLLIKISLPGWKN